MTAKKKKINKSQNKQQSVLLKKQNISQLWHLQITKWKYTSTKQNTGVGKTIKKSTISAHQAKV